MYFKELKGRSVIRDNTDCRMGADTMSEALPKQNITISEWIRVPGEDELVLTKKLLDDYLDRIQERGRRK